MRWREYCVSKLDMFHYMTSDAAATLGREVLLLLKLCMAQLLILLERSAFKTCPPCANASKGLLFSVTLPHGGLET